MRITSFDTFNLNQMRMSQLQQYSNDLMVKITTGKDFQRISENPVRANASMLVTTGIAKIEQYQANLSDLQGYVQTAESYLGMAVEDLQRTTELGLQAANETYNAQDRQSFVLELENLIEHMVGMGNSQYLGKYMFSGQKTDVKPLEYDGQTLTYNGSQNVNAIRVSANMEIDVSVTAEEALVDTIRSMIELRDAITTGNNTNIGNALQKVQQNGEAVLNTRSELGVRMRTVEMMNESYAQNKLELQTRKSKAEDVDASEVIMKYMNAQSLYQGAIQSTLKMYENSLLNYM